MTIELAPHDAVVVGAAGAIGGAICHAYARAGARVAVLDLDLEAAQRLAAALAGDGHRAGQIDVTDPSSGERAAAEAGAIDSLVYCAGVAFTAEVAATSWQEYRRLMAVNLDGAFYTSAAFVRRLLGDGRHASLVFLSSTAGLRGEAGASAYCASKFGLIGLVESLAAELSGAGIRANAICPGNVDSPLLRSVAAAQAEREGASAEELIERFARSGAATRLVETDEVAATALWLASCEASGVTGESIRVDVGQMVG